MRKLLLVGLVVAAPILVASTETASACGWGYYGYSAPRVYGYTAPRFYYGYTSYAPRRFYGARVFGWRAGWGVRRWAWGGWRRW
jgi:hypothetical protein